MEFRHVIDNLLLIISLFNFTKEFYISVEDLRHCWFCAGFMTLGCLSLQNIAKLQRRTNNDGHKFNAHAVSLITKWSASFQLPIIGLKLLCFRHDCNTVKVEFSYKVLLLTRIKRGRQRE